MLELISSPRLAQRRIRNRDDTAKDMEIAERHRDKGAKEVQKHEEAKQKYEEVNTKARARCCGMPSGSPPSLSLSFFSIFPFVFTSCRIASRSLPWVPPLRVPRSPDPARPAQLKYDLQAALNDGHPKFRGHYDKLVQSQQKAFELMSTSSQELL